MDLTDWKYLFNFGYSGDVYGKDNKRVMVDGDTGQVIIEYEMATYASSTPDNSPELPTLPEGKRNQGETLKVWQFIYRGG